MTTPDRDLVTLERRHEGRLALVTLDDPDRRNALSDAMFDGLARAIATTADERTVAILLRGAGPAFCAGFDLAACVADPPTTKRLVERLGALTRSLRRHPAVVIGAVHGAAIAGGCAIVSACDIVIAAPDARFGYPVHRIGLSPAVTTATLSQAIGAGRARALMLSGELIDGAEAHRRGLAHRLASSAAALERESLAFAESFLDKGPQALRITKAWINELDGSLDDARFDGPARDSAEAALSEETRTMLAAFWRSR